MSKDNKEDDIINNLMSDEQFEEVYRKLREAMTPLLDVMSHHQNNVTDALKPIIKSLNEQQKQLSDSITPFISSLNIFQDNMAKQMEPIYQGLPKILESFSNFQRISSFLNILTKNHWPVHLYNEDDFMEIVLNSKSDIDELIINYFTTKKLDEIKDFIIKSDTSRTALYKEAFDNYYNDKFYSCVSLLICQIDDLVLNEKGKLKYKEYIKNSEIDIQEMIKDLNHIYETKFDKDNKKDRYKLLIANYEEVFLPRVFFIKMVLKTYKPTDSIKKWEKLPYRNKICHGKQLNFGTKSHALKTIFLVYGLCKVNDNYSD